MPQLQCYSFIEVQQLVDTQIIQVATKMRARRNIHSAHKVAG